MRLLAVFILVFSNLIAPLLPGHSWLQDRVSTAYDLIAAVNALRASHGLKPYVIDPLLMLSAQMQADYIASQYPNIVDGHVGPGGTDADARAKAVGFPYVPGLDINENWAAMSVGTPFIELFNGGWSDAAHMHTMLHPRGQLVGAGVAVAGSTMFIILNVAAYWGDAGKTPWPTSSGYGTPGSPPGISQYIAPVKIATPRADGSIIHQVQSGQSLWSIAIKYGVTIESIRRLNNINPDGTIYIGQKLIVKGPGSITPTSVQMTDTLSLSDFLPPKSTAQLNTNPTQVTRNRAPLALDPIGIFLLLFVLGGAGLILVFIGLRR